MAWRVVDPRVSVLLAPNPGPMTLDGTNTYRLAAPGSTAAVVVDPGPDDPGHLAALVAAGPVELILITHRHADHTAGAPALAAATGAPVRAADPAHCRDGAPLTGDEIVRAGGLDIFVLATPGHTADSVSFRLADARPADTAAAAASAAADAAAAPVGALVLTGDTVLGRGTTVLAPPDGSLGDYLRSLDLLVAAGPARGLPAHGPELPDLTAACRAYRVHREQRLAQVAAVVRDRGLDPTDPDTVGAVTDVVYAQVDPAVRAAAESSVRAQLRYLAGGAR